MARGRDVSSSRSATQLLSLRRTSSTRRAGRIGPAPRCYPGRSPGWRTGPGTAHVGLVTPACPLSLERHFPCLPSCPTRSTAAYERSRSSCSSKVNPIAKGWSTRAAPHPRRRVSAARARCSPACRGAAGPNVFPVGKPAARGTVVDSKDDASSTGVCKANDGIHQHLDKSRLWIPWRSPTSDGVRVTLEVECVCFERTSRCTAGHQP